MTFRVDATPFVEFGTGNTIAVRVDTRSHFSRWYPGAGIYRKVTMTVEHPVHIANWGIYVTTPEITDEAAKIDIKTTVENHMSTSVTVTIETIILDPSGRKVASTESALSVDGTGSRELGEVLTVEKSRRWDIDDPARNGPRLTLMVMICRTSQSRRLTATAPFAP